jgi:hypothetical protein
MGEYTRHDRVSIFSRCCRTSLVLLLVGACDSEVLRRLEEQMLRGYYQSRSPSWLSVFKAYNSLTYGLVHTITATKCISPSEGFRCVRIGIRTLQDLMARSARNGDYSDPCSFPSRLKSSRVSRKMTLRYMHNTKYYSMH